MYYQYEFAHFKGNMGHGVASDVSLLDEEADFSSEFATLTTLPLPFRADVVVAACCS